MAIQNKPTLYERLWGVYSIATVVDDFISQIMVDPRWNASHGWTKPIIGCPERGSSTS
jgi:hypothetical protein